MARALNDTPKIVALGAGFLVVPGLSACRCGSSGDGAAAMVTGSWAGGHRVTHTSRGARDAAG